MTRNIWTRIIVASLIFLGDWAFATKNKLRTDIEADANDITVQISKQAILDDTISKSEPAITGVETTPPVIFSINLTLVSIAHIALDKLKYLPSHPRAPPLTATW